MAYADYVTSSSDRSWRPLIDVDVMQFWATLQAVECRQ